MQWASDGSTKNCCKQNEHCSQSDIQPVIPEAVHAHSTQAAMAEAAMRRAMDAKSEPVGAHVVTSAAQPFQILGCNEAFLKLTGHQSIGSSLKILYGKTTRISALESSISAAEDGGVHECQLQLYTANAQPLLVRVAVSVVHAKECEMSRHLCAEVAKVMLLVLSPVKSIRRASEASEDASPGARVVVQNKVPFHIESVSAGWKQMFGMSESALLGRSLRVLEGPRTDQRAVNRFMASVTRGVEGKASFMTYNVDGQRLWTHFSVSPLLSSAGTIDSFVAEACSYKSLDLDAAISSNEGYLILVEAESGKHRAHASRDLCKLLNLSDDLAFQVLMDEPANRKLISSLVAEVVHGDVSQQLARPYMITLTGATALRHKLDAQVSELSVVDADCGVTHLLIHLHINNTLHAEDEKEQLRARVLELEAALAAAQRATAEANINANAALQSVTSLRLQMNNMLALVTSSPTDPRLAHLAQAWTAEDEDMDDEEAMDGAQEHHCVFRLHPAFEGALGAHALLQRMQQERVVEGVVDASLVEKFARKFEQKHLATGCALCDGDGSILWPNPLFVEATGYAAQEIMGCQWHTFLCGPATGSAEVSRVQSMMQLRLPFSSCMRLHQEDGSVVWMQVRGEPAVLNGGPMLLLCIEDVSDVMHDTSNYSAQSLYQTSQVQEEAVVHGLAILEGISSPVALHNFLQQQQQQHEHVAPAAAPVHGLSRLSLSSRPSRVISRHILAVSRLDAAGKGC